MPDLHGWITQQIDRREDLAKRAAHYGRLNWPQPATAVVDVGDSWPITTEAGPIAEHISVHDPATVLHRCEADRKILKIHAPQGGDWEPYACEGCGSDSEYGVLVDHTNDCETLIALAEGYGLTEEQRTALDRPEPAPRQQRMSGFLGSGLAEAMYGNLIAHYIGTQRVEPRPEVKALKILEPELKKIPGYVPIPNDPPPA
ncbi:DUF6221 family protein [Streptomyces sp. NPDC005496]|uniref:DUF6221 family protein n=1 Tax=unclassified Streptomyces TaxID=2593676 RepID=UPI0033B4A457